MSTTAEKQREGKRQYAAQSRASVRDIAIGDVQNPRLRKRLEKSIYDWLTHYFADLFYNPFNEQQKTIIQAVLHAAEHGGDQAIAAPRGEGKTSICECVVIYCLLTGKLKFPLIISATGPDAQAVLSNVKRQFETNEALHANYPEVCSPVWELEGASQRANMQTCLDGHRTRIKWGMDKIILPDVPKFTDSKGTVVDSQCRGSVLATRGLDSAIRGIRVGKTRPDLVLIDDPETRESVESDTQIEKRCKTIEQDIGGLGGPGRRMARLMLCTIMNRKGVAYQYTDPQQKPSWRGVRYRMLISEPERADLWDEYVELRRSAMAAAVQSGRSVDEAQGEATDFYRQRRAEMDAGAEVANPHRFDPHHELSALQRCFNIIADSGKDAFATEFQNDPPESAGPQESGIYPGLVASRLSGLERGVIPPNCHLVTAAVDIGKVALHWVVTAWSKAAWGSVIDYGVQDVWPTNRDSDQAVEMAILQALFALRDVLAGAGYATPDGEIQELQTVLIDSGYKERPVYEFCRQTAGTVYKPSKGMGDSVGARRSYFRAPDKDTPGKRVGEHCFAAYQEAAKIWLFGLDADYWKSWLHQRFMTPDGQPGSLSLFGNDKRQHVAYSHHICAEVEVEEFVEGKGLKRYWKKVNPNNHWLDTSYMACCAAAMNGMTLIQPAAGARPAPTRRASGRGMQAHFMQRPGGWVRGMR